MLRLVFCLAFMALLPSPAFSAGEFVQQGYTFAAPKAKDGARDPRKAAAIKRKELRGQGVKNVHAKSPGDWPSKVPAPADMSLRELPAPEDGKGHLYESDNYVFSSPTALSPEGQHMIAQLFECTYAADKAIGKVLPVPRTELPRSEKKYPVMLVKNEAAYRAAGGPEGSAGVYMHSKRFPVVNDVPQTAGRIAEEQIVSERVLVPLTALGLDEQGRISTKGKDIDTHTLVHEITHQNFVLNNLPIALNEGWAEYVGYVPYIGNELDFDRGFSLIVHEAQRFADAGAMHFPFSLEDFLSMDQGTMYGYMQQGNGACNTYLLGCMLVAYYVHLDGKRGIEAMRRYMEAVADGMPHEEAARLLVEPHRNNRQLEKDFIRAWKSKGVRGLSFEGK